MGCGGSKLIQPPPGGWGQSAALRKLLIGGGDGESSPQPSLELKTVAGSDYFGLSKPYQAFAGLIGP